MKQDYLRSTLPRRQSARLCSTALGLYRSTLFAVAENWGARQGEPKHLYCTKPYSLFSIAARLVRWQQASRTFVVFPKRDARER
ncbi:MAG: hypothetical protein ACREA9_04610, partial [Pyrinomonadaceae bacterium]